MAKIPRTILPFELIRSKEDCDDQLGNLVTLLEYLLKLIEPDADARTVEQKQEGKFATVGQWVDFYRNIFSHEELKSVFWSIRVRNKVTHSEITGPDTNLFDVKKAVSNLFLMIETVVLPRVNVNYMHVVDYVQGHLDSSEQGNETPRSPEVHDKEVLAQPSYLLHLLVIAVFALLCTFAIKLHRKDVSIEDGTNALNKEEAELADREKAAANARLEMILAVRRSNKKALPSIEAGLNQLVEVDKEIITLVNTLNCDKLDEELSKRLSSDEHDIYKRWRVFVFDFEGKGGKAFVYYKQNREEFQRVLSQALKDCSIAREILFDENWTQDSDSHMPSIYDFTVFIERWKHLTAYYIGIKELLADAKALSSYPSHGFSARQRVAIEGIQGFFRPYCWEPEGVDVTLFVARPERFYPLSRSFVSQLIFVKGSNGEDVYRQKSLDLLLRFTASYRSMGYAFSMPYEGRSARLSNLARWQVNQIRAKIYTLRIILEEYPEVFLSDEHAVRQKAINPSAPYLPDLEQYRVINFNHFLREIKPR